MNWVPGAVVRWLGWVFCGAARKPSPVQMVAARRSSLAAALAAPPPQARPPSTPAGRQLRSLVGRSTRKMTKLAARQLGSSQNNRRRKAAGEYCSIIQIRRQAGHTRQEFSCLLLQARRELLLYAPRTVPRFAKCGRVSDWRRTGWELPRPRLARVLVVGTSCLAGSAQRSMFGHTDLQAARSNSGRPKQFCLVNS